MYQDLAAFAESLRTACAAEHAQFYVVYHINPDGDCIGSAHALVLLLRTLGASAAVLGRDAVPEQFRALTDLVPQETLGADAQYIAVDCKDRSRTGKTFADLPYQFWIDHHGSPEEQAVHEYVHPESSSCGELILALAEALGAEISLPMANLLYTALVTDTSRFCTVNTNARSFEAAARLMRYGADAYTIGRAYTFAKSPERLKMERRVFDGMHILCGGRLVTCIITLDDLRAAGISAPDAPALQNINSLPEVIPTALITVMVREYPADHPEERSRFSIKTTRPALSARAIAEHFGGGGHPQAAGGFLPDAPEHARAILEEYCAGLL